MQATLRLERIERRVSADLVSDAEWLRSTVDHSDGRLRIVDSRRYTDADVERHGAERVLAWIAEDHRRHRQFQRGRWWFIDVQAVAIVGMHLTRERIGHVLYVSPVVVMQSDAPREHLDRVTDILVDDVKRDLAQQGFNDLDVPTPYVLTERWVADAIS